MVPGICEYFFIIIKIVSIYLGISSTLLDWFVRLRSKYGFVILVFVLWSFEHYQKTENHTQNQVRLEKNFFPNSKTSYLQPCPRKVSQTSFLWSQICKNWFFDTCVSFSYEMCHIFRKWLPKWQNPQLRRAVTRSSGGVRKKIVPFWNVGCSEVLPCKIWWW